jgi:hypothetical protein
MYTKNIQNPINIIVLDNKVIIFIVLLLLENITNIMLINGAIKDKTIALDNPNIILVLVQVLIFSINGNTNNKYLLKL